MILEEENKNDKKEENKELKEKKEEKELNLIKEEKDKSKNIIKNKPIIKREIKKDINNIPNKIIKPITLNEYKLPISEIWADKFVLRLITDIIGNQQQLRNLKIWLDNWDNFILQDYKNEANKTGKKNSKNENENARAAIISDPPGIGKTSSIRVLTKNKGYRTFELISSDKRNKDTINNSVGF